MSTLQNAIAPLANEHHWWNSAWISRAVLIPPTAILTLISFRFILNPSHSIVAAGLGLNQPQAITDTRVIGALSLTLAVLLLSAIFSQHRLRLGHAIVILVMGLVLVVRIWGFAADGTTLSMGDELQKTIGEILFLTLNSAVLFLQRNRLHQMTAE